MLLGGLMWTEQRLKKYREKAEISRFKPFEHEIRWRGYKMATKILKLQRKSIFSENMITENPENRPFATQGSPNLIREGGRTVGSGRVATIIE